MPAIQKATERYIVGYTNLSGLSAEGLREVVGREAVAAARAFALEDGALAGKRHQGVEKRVEAQEDDRRAAVGAALRPRRLPPHPAGDGGNQAALEEGDRGDEVVVGDLEAAAREHRGLVQPPRVPLRRAAPRGRLPPLARLRWRAAL